MLLRHSGVLVSSALLASSSDLGRFKIGEGVDTRPWIDAYHSLTYAHQVQHIHSLNMTVCRCGAAGWGALICPAKLSFDGVIKLFRGFGCTLALSRTCFGLLWGCGGRFLPGVRSNLYGPFRRRLRFSFALWRGFSCGFGVP